MRVWILLAWGAFAHATEPSLLLIGEIAMRGSPAPIALQTRAGDKFDTDTIERDVRALHATGRFADIRVESEDGDAGLRVTFHLLRTPRFMLRKVHVIPDEFSLKARVAEGEAVDAARAQAMARKYRRQLAGAGYTGAEVRPELIAVGPSTADVRLHVNEGQRVRIHDVQIGGDTGIGRKALHELKPRWLRRPVYSTAAIDADLARVQSAYLARGYVDATVRLDHTAIVDGTATVHLTVQPGNQHPVRGDLCASLVHQRRDSERKGAIDFTAEASIDEAGMLSVRAMRGRSYVIRRIDFVGNRKFSDASIRRNMSIEETELLDVSRIRKSIDRLNRSAMFEPLSESDVDVRTDGTRGLADVRIRLRERKAGSWLLAGPAGPVNIAGPFKFSLASRLPSWGQGILDLSSYFASLHLGPGEVVFALQRPFVPGHGLLSGFAIAPQIGWRNIAAGYAGTQLRERFIQRGSLPEPSIPVTVQRASGEALMICEPPAPRWLWLRRGVSMALQLGSMIAI